MEIDKTASEFSPDWQGGVPQKPFEIPPKQNVSKFIRSIYIIITKIWLEPRVFIWQQDFRQNHQTLKNPIENPEQLAGNQNPE